jgi:hypothetical protein
VPILLGDPLAPSVKECIPRLDQLFQLLDLIAHVFVVPLFHI